MSFDRLSEKSAACMLYRTAATNGHGKGAGEIGRFFGCTVYCIQIYPYLNVHDASSHKSLI